MTTEIEVVVNGRSCRVRIEPRQTLAEVLREELDLTGTHLACEHGVCGACSVRLDDEVVRSCLVLGVQVEGSDVRTIEGHTRGGGLGPVQQGFLEAMSFQCGFCTPGIVVATAMWIERRRETSAGPPPDGEIREMLASNLCRCTGYQAIVDGVRRAWELSAEEDGTCND